MPLSCTRLEVFCWQTLCFDMVISPRLFSLVHAAFVFNFCFVLDFLPFLSALPVPAIFFPVSSSSTLSGDCLAARAGHTRRLPPAAGRVREGRRRESPHGLCDGVLQPARARLPHQGGEQASGAESTGIQGEGREIWVVGFCVAE